MVPALAVGQAAEQYTVNCEHQLLWQPNFASVMSSFDAFAAADVGQEQHVSPGFDWVRPILPAKTTALPSHNQEINVALLAALSCCNVRVWLRLQRLTKKLVQSKHLVLDAEAMAD